MSKKKLELKNQIEQLKAEARQLVEENKLEEAKAKAEEAKNLKKQLDLLDELDEMDVNGGIELPKGELKDKKEEEELYKNAFLKAFRGKVLTAEERNIIEIKNALTETTDADGGLLVPQDIQTAINEYKRTLPRLEALINIIPVTTLTGSRVFEKIATMTPFANITDDTADIDDMGSPQFEKVSYAVKKYAGWMPIPNDLLADSDQNILNYLKTWIARKSVVTRNSLIIALLNTLAKVDFADWKAIKKAINVTLDPMIAAGATIVTNQDGFQYLDTLTDGQNRPLLKPDVTQPSNQLLFGKPIVIVPNTVLPTTGTTTKKAPLIVGNLIELITMFERQGYQIASTNIGGTAFRKDRTELRCIEREDIKLIDSGAAVYGQIDVTSVV